MRRSTTSRLGALLLSTVSALSPPPVGCSCGSEEGLCSAGAYLTIGWVGVPLTPVRAEGACGGLRCVPPVAPPPGHSESEGVWCGYPQGVVTGNPGDICRLIVGGGVLVVDTPIPEPPEGCRDLSTMVLIDADAYRRAAGGSGGSGGSR